MTDIFIKIAAVLALLAMLFFGEQYIERRGYDRRAVEDQAATNQLKAEAAATLAAETKARLDATAKLANLIAQQENDREIKQLANRADLRARLSGPRLQYHAEAGRGGSGGSTSSAALGAASDPETAVVQLPKQVSDDLWGFAADAQSLAIDYGVLYAYVHNPKLVCELRP